MADTATLALVDSTEQSEIINDTIHAVVNLSALSAATFRAPQNNLRILGLTLRGESTKMITSH